jgi:hypothetical protein
MFFLFGFSFLILKLTRYLGYSVLFRFRITVSRVILLFPIIKVFKVTLWLFSLFFFKLIFFSFFERVTSLSVYYIRIPFLFMGRITHFFI